MTDRNEHNEEYILGLIKQNVPSAMKLLYDRNIEYMSAVCSRYIADVNDQKDVLQESFIKILTSIGKFQFRGEGSLRSWMIRITVNESLTFLRKNASQTIIDFEENLPDTPDEPEIEGISDEVINEMILSLAPGFRMVFNLYVFENKSHKEIAKLLGISESTSASQFLRAKTRLARMIKEYKKHI
ncbi:MAG: RNA polymerase sigma factor [Prevotellaceae bacterium]|nr:RNA polymerase sigma factor [Prevotellaceae bacterium]